MSFQNALSIDQLNSVLDGGLSSIANSSITKGRHFRYYNLVAKKDAIILTFENVIAQQASRIRKQMKADGFAVDMTDIETMELSFRHRVSQAVECLEAPKIDTSKEPGCVPEYMSIKNHNWHVAMANRLRNMDRVNRQNARDFINTENAKTRIYEKVSGQLQFVGSLEDGITFIQGKIASGEWNQLNWVIYLPDGVYQEVVNNV